MNIGKPILVNLKTLEPKIHEKFAEYTPGKVSLTVGISSFVISMLVHMGYVHFVKPKPHSNEPLSFYAS